MVKLNIHSEEIIKEDEYVTVTIFTRKQFEDATLHGFPVYRRTWQDDKGMIHLTNFITVKWTDLMKLGD